MPKNVSISEGGKPKKFSNTARLLTDTTGTELTPWVPADERLARQKYITKNGTYYARDDEVYAFSKVTVNVSGGIQGQTTPTTKVPIADGMEGISYEIPNSAIDSGDYTLPEYVTESPDVVSPLPISPGSIGTSITGIDPTTGNKSIMSVKPDGTVDSKAIPSYIRVVFPPSKVRYNQGEKIIYAGITVKAYHADDTTHEDETFWKGGTWNGNENVGGKMYGPYMDGDIPYFELEFPTENAPYLDPSERGNRGSDADSITVGGVTQTGPIVGSPIEAGDTLFLLNGNEVKLADNFTHTKPLYASYVIRPSSDDKNNIVGGIFSEESFGELIYGPGYGDNQPARRITFNGKTFYSRGWLAGTINREYLCARCADTDSVNTDLMGYTILFGKDLGTRTKTIEVDWTSPYDGAKLTDEFEIDVVATTEDDGFSGSGGGTF